MNVAAIWVGFYQRFVDDETRSAQLFADFICWCHVEKITNNQARRIIFEAAATAQLALPKDFFTIAFTSLVPRFPGEPDPNDEDLRDPPNEPTRHQAGIFRAVLQQFYSREFLMCPTGAASQVLLDVFSVVNDLESLLRIIESGDGAYSRICDRKVMDGNEFYSLSELNERLGAEVLDEFLRESGYSRESDPLILGNEVIEWQMQRKGFWRFPEPGESGAESDDD